MKIQEAISQADALRPTDVDRRQKIKWLETVDAYVFREIISTRQDATVEEAPVYDEADGGRELLVPPPYDELYLYLLEAKIYYATREMKKYAGAMALYNQTVSEYTAWYFKNHRQKNTPTPVYY